MCQDTLVERSDAIYNMEDKETIEVSEEHASNHKVRSHPTAM